MTTLNKLAPEQLKDLTKKAEQFEEKFKTTIPELMEIDPRFSLFVTLITLNYLETVASGVNPKTFGICIFEAIDYYRKNLLPKEPRE